MYLMQSTWPNCLRPISQSVYENVCPFSLQTQTNQCLLLPIIFSLSSAVFKQQHFKTMKRLQVVERTFHGSTSLFALRIWLMSFTGMGRAINIDCCLSHFIPIPCINSLTPHKIYKTNFKAIEQRKNWVLLTGIDFAERNLFCTN